MKVTFERTQASLREPEFLNDVCIHLAEGGTLKSFCFDKGLQYLMVFQWITLDSGRNEVYQNALKARRQMLEDIVIDKLRVAVLADPRKVFNKAGEALRAHEIPDDIVPALASIKRTESDSGRVTNEVRMLDSLRASELLGKTSSMFKEVQEVRGDDTLADLLKAARAKVAQPEEANG